VAYVVGYWYNPSADSLSAHFLTGVQLFEPFWLTAPLFLLKVLAWDCCSQESRDYSDELTERPDSTRNESVVISRLENLDFFVVCSVYQPVFVRDAARPVSC
jgi:hypothetical protein